VPEWSRDDCLVVTSGKLARCTWGRATAARTVAVVGDSMAVNWLPAVRRALTPLGYRVVALTMAQCPAGEVAVKDTGGSTGFAPQCAAHLAWDVAQLRRLRPRLVLATSAMETRYRLVSGASGSAALAEWRRGAARFLDRVRPLTSRLVVADPAPVRVPLADCATRFSRPADCVSPLGADDRTFDAATARAASAAGAAHVATASWFCVHGRCPAFADGAPLYVDREHLTGAYAVRLAPVLRQALERAGALPR
jgi:hypothetical protein